MSRAAGRRAWLVACAVTIGVLTTAVPASAVEVVKGDGTRWRPSSVSVSQGEAVRWRSVFRAHVVQSYGTNWNYRRSIPQGQSVRRVFNTGGTFRFYCTIHGTVSGGSCSGMCGRVTVG